MTFPSPACALVSSSVVWMANLGDAAAEGLGALAAAEVDQVEAAAATKEGRCGRGGGVQATNIAI